MPEFLQKYLPVTEDLCSPSIQNLLDDSERLNAIKTKVKELAASEMQKTKVKKGELVGKIIISLADLGYAYKDSEKIVKDVVDKYGIEKDINFLKQEAARSLLLINGDDKDSKDNTGSSSTKNSKKQKRKRYTSEEINKFKDDNVIDTFEGIIAKEE